MESVSLELKKNITCSLSNNNENYMRTFTFNSESIKDVEVEFLYYALALAEKPIAIAN